MRVLFRTDASYDIGSGHVMRCLTLADVLRKNGVQCVFICRSLIGNLTQQIRIRGFICEELTAYNDCQFLGGDMAESSVSPYAKWLGVTWQQDAEQTAQVIEHYGADWLVVDHYGLDTRWERSLSKQCNQILVIDDLADRQHTCKILLDQNWGRDACHYHQLLPAHCTLLTGSRYALLRPEFAQLREYSLARRSSTRMQRILITMGGVDKDNVTGRVLTSLNDCNLPIDTQITVVLGAQCQWKEQVSALAQQQRQSTQVLVDVKDMAQLMAETDLCIGAAGSTSWERCALGIPSVLICLANNQKMVIESLAQSGAAITMDYEEFGKFGAQVLNRALSTARDKLLSMSQVASTICDGAGTSRLLKLMMERT